MPQNRSGEKEGRDRADTAWKERWRRDEGASATKAARAAASAAATTARVTAFAGSDSSAVGKGGSNEKRARRRSAISSPSRG
jgi:hypothetical protein